MRISIVIIVETPKVSNGNAVFRVHRRDAMFVSEVSKSFVFVFEQSFTLETFRGNPLFDMVFTDVSDSVLRFLLVKN